MTAYARGGPLDPPLSVYFRSAGVLVSVVGPTVTLVDADGTTVVSEAAPTGNPSTGLYTYDGYALPDDAPLGDWTATWAATYLGSPVGGSETFTVLEAGTVTFAPNDADLITLEQYEARNGEVPAGDVAQIAALIEDASALVRDIIHDDVLTGGWDASIVGTVPRSVVPVMTSMVRRGYTNPHGFTSESQQGYSYNGVSGVSVFATPQEAATLRRATRRGSPRAIELTAGLPLQPFDGWV